MYDLPWPLGPRGAVTRCYGESKISDSQLSFARSQNVLFERYTDVQHELCGRVWGSGKLDVPRMN